MSTTTCIRKNCKKKPCWNNNSENERLYCKNCAIEIFGENAKYILQQQECLEDGCTIQPYFNYIGNT